MHAPIDLADSVADVVARIRSRAPRVHCITNSVAQQYTANMLLAAGAVPSMTLSPDEIGAFVTGADALLVNLGTFDAERKSAIGAALTAATEHGVPWLLDPVFIERSPARAQFARDLVGRGVGTDGAVGDPGSDVLAQVGAERFVPFAEDPGQIGSRGCLGPHQQECPVHHRQPAERSDVAVDQAQ